MGLRGGKGRSKRKRYMYAYSRFTLLYRKNQNNTVKQLYASTNQFKRKKQTNAPLSRRPGSRDCNASGEILCKEPKVSFAKAPRWK